MKGLSALFRHPPFDVSKGVVIDVLHGLYLGVVLSLLSLWFDKVNRNMPFYIGDKVCTYVHTCISM